ncbi:hypothetical protein NL676_016194 [Syzygium grande]|nr:hypothetical protein NL676_016194 [Syzygium grande]
MRNVVAHKSCFLLLLLFTSQFALATKKTLNKERPCERFVLYNQDILFSGGDVANLTSAVVTNGTGLENFYFGSLIVFNDLMTRDNHLLSPVIT